MTIAANYILTYRSGEGPERRRNLCAVLGWLATLQAFEPLVVEQDSVPRLDGPLPHPRVRVLFAYNPGPFNKSWGLNVGFRAATLPLLAFGDADIVVGQPALEALRYLHGGHQTAKPYRRLLDLDEDESQRVAGGDYDWVPTRATDAPRNREGIGEHLVFAGGVFLITRAAFLSVGGWDERFRGWGGEDDSLSYRIERARLSGVELDTRPALHLHHPRPVAATSGQPHYAANLALLQDHRRCTDAELNRFAEVQAQLLGHREKYRPPA